MSNEQQPNAYDIVIADLERERDKLSITIEALKKIRQLGVSFEATSNFFTGEPPAIMPKMPIPHDAFFGMTIPEAARKFLGWEGSRQTKSNGELVDGMLAGGFKTTAANFAESVRSTLSRNEDFVKVQGRWGLSAWYENRGGKTRQRRSSGPLSSPSTIETSASEIEPEPEAKKE
jgi:hypothetical protein